MWFDATDDGREYRGWDATRDALTSVLAAGPVGVIGFRQGAVVAAALAAMASRAAAPPIQFAILVAGRPPRADALQPFLTERSRCPRSMSGATPTRSSATTRARSPICSSRRRARS